MLAPSFLRLFALSAALAVIAARPVAAQTWNGSAGISWATPGNWSGGFPVSNANTALTFGAATNDTTDQGLGFPFQLNSMTFTSAAASAYTVQDLPIQFLATVTTNPSITQNSTKAVTFTNGLTLSDPLFLPGGGAGTLSLNGSISGAGSINKNGSGTAVLGAANSFTGDVSVTGGILSITDFAAIPSGRNVTVGSGATFRLDSTTGTNSTAPIGTLALTGGTLRVPAGNADYFVNKLTSSNGGAVDLTGSANFFLHLTGSGAGINVTSAATWVGGSSLIRNDTAGTIDFALNGNTLTNGIRLGAGSSGQGFRVVGGELRQTAAGSDAPLVVDGGFYQFADPTFVTAGALTVQSTGILSYTGAANANISKSFSLGAGGGQVESTAGGTLTMSGVIGETGGTGRGLFIGGGTVVLAGNNTYSGPTTIYGGGVAAVDLSVANELGASSDAPANLVISNGALRFTGASLTSSRGATLSSATSTIDVPAAASVLGIRGQVVGTGALNKTGTGTLILANPVGSANSTNSYSGGTVVSAGTLQLFSPSDQIPPNGNVTVAAGATFDIGSPGTFTNQSRPAGTITLNGGRMTAQPAAAGTISTYSAGAVVMTGGTIDFSHANDNSLTSPTGTFLFLNTGVTINPSSSTAVWAGPSGGFAILAPATAAGLTITVGQGTTPSGIDLDSSFSLNGTTSSFPFVKAGPGVMRMNVQNSSDARLTVTGGKLRLDSAFIFNLMTSNRNTITLAGGGLQYGGGSIFTDANPLTLGGGGGVIEVMTGGVTLTLPGAIGGGGALTKSGPGTLELTNAANTYAGITFVSSGVLSAAALADGGSNSSIGASGNASGALLIAGATLKYTGPTVTTDRGFTVTDAASSVEVTTAAANVTFTGVVGGSGGLTKTGPGTLTLGGSSANTYAGDTTVNAGTLALGKTGGAAAVLGTLSINGPGTVRLLANDQIADTATVLLAGGAGVTATLDTNGKADTVGVVSGGGTISGGGTLTTNLVVGTTASGNPTVAAGTTLNTAQIVGVLTVNGAVNVKRQSAGGVTSAVNLLTIAGTTGAWTGRLDLADDRLVVNYTGGSPLATVADQVKAGYAGGGANAWKGNGIRSSLADAGRFAVGYGEASAVLNITGSQTGTFGGQTVDATSVLVRYTLYGDANLDGTVDIADFARLQNAFNQPVTAGWGAGDFNYDGVVNIADFALLQNNFNQSAPNGGLAAAAAAGATPADFAAVAAFAADVGAASVPEPGAAAIVAVAAVGLLARRRGRNGAAHD